MDIESVRIYCLQKKASSESFPFDETTLFFKVMDKMFACLSLTDSDKLVLKCDADLAITLRDRYPEIIEPAWHFNKRYWNQLRLSQLSDKLIKELIDHSYNEVLKKFTRKMKDLYNNK